MRIRAIWKMTIVILLALAWWTHDFWRNRLTQIVEHVRTGQFVEEASRSQAFLIDGTDWLEFDVPRNGNILRVLTNAGLKEIPPQAVALDTERPGWRYAVQYQLLDRQDQVLSESKYHFRAQLTQYIDPESRESYMAATFGDVSLLPAGTRTLQFPLSGFAKEPHRLRVRLVTKDAEVEEVSVRVYCRSERPGYDRPSTWNRVSQPRREKLCRASVYPPGLISPAERHHLLRWQWLPLPPNGLSGVDHQRRILYTLDDVRGQEVGVDVNPLGQPLRKGLHGVIPLPEEPGTARIEVERVQLVDDLGETSRVQMHWYGPTIHQRRTFEIELNDAVTSYDFAAEGGLLVAESDDELVIRMAWRATTAQQDEPFRDMTPAPAYVRTYRTESGQPVDYTVTHLEEWTTPYSVALRRHGGVSAASGVEPPARAIDSVHVQWQFLDSDQQVVAQGLLAADGIKSPYDFDSQSNESVTEPSTYFFDVPRGVTRIRFRSPGPPVLISCSNRPPDLAKVTRVPEDYSAFYRRESTSRNWFMIRPDDHLRLMEEARTVTIQVQSRPPEDNPDILAGNYLWEDFRPAGFWRAHYLLTPRNPSAPIRDEALTTTFVELKPGRDYAVRFVRDPNRSAIEPRLIYVVDDASTKSLDVFVNGRLYHTVKCRAPRGEVVLPPLGAQASAARHTLHVRADGRVRVFVNSVNIPTQPSYIKRIALNADGPLRFEYDKMLPGKEILALCYYGDVGRNERTKLRVQVSAPTVDGATTSSAGWTMRHREFDLKPSDATGHSIVLGASEKYMGSGRVCYIPLGEDLPVGRYPIDVELTEGKGGYVVISKITAGMAPDRKFFIDRQIELPWRSGSNVGSESTNQQLDLWQGARK